MGCHHLIDKKISTQEMNTRNYICIWIGLCLWIILFYTRFQCIQRERNGAKSSEPSKIRKNIAAMAIKSSTQLIKPNGPQSASAITNALDFLASLFILYEHCTRSSTSIFMLLIISEIPNRLILQFIFIKKYQNWYIENPISYILRSHNLFVCGRILCESIRGVLAKPCAVRRAFVSFFFPGFKSYFIRCAKRPKTVSLSLI